MRDENVSLEDAQKIMREERDRLKDSIGTEVFHINNISPHTLLDRVLAEDVVANRDLPPFDVATMDGFALRVPPLYPLTIKGKIQAGEYGDGKEIGVRESFGIATGAILPKGANAVLPVECAEIKEDVLTGGEVKKGEFVLLKGSDVRKGEVVAKKGMFINERILALCTLSDEICIYKKPRVGVIGSGDEIVDGLMPDSNTHMVCAYLCKMGVDAVRIGVVQDDYSILEETISNASKKYDVVITVGGISVGEKDFVRAILENEGEVVFQGVRIKPGKPVSFWYFNDTPVLSLPGKPTGAFTALELVGSKMFGDIIRRSCWLRIGEKVAGQCGYVNVLYGDMDSGYFVPNGVKNGKYNTSIVSACLSTIKSSCYTLFENSIEKDEQIEVFLL
ncbi:hypothetical protein DRN72_03810 [Methanosarcinales archaeon]|nr:MAG: hypothetical protein DRN72_03810 [Methanosarcinales archaeon]